MSIALNKSQKAAQLTVHDLTVRFGGLTAVDNVSFTIPAGGLAAVIGPNGAGKTTLFNAISGVHPASSGAVVIDDQPLASELCGRDIAKGLAQGIATGAAAAFCTGVLPAWAAATDPSQPFTWCGSASAALQSLCNQTAAPWAALAGLGIGITGAGASWQRRRTRPEGAAEAGIARTFQNLRLFRDLSVLDNVRLGFHRHLRVSAIASALRLPSHRRNERAAHDAAMDALQLVGLDRVAYRIAGHLPYAHQRRLEIARALACRPRLLLLDEPAAGMNPVEADALAGLLRAIRDRGITVILIDHHMRLIMNVAEHVVVLHHGALLASGSPAAVRADPLVIDAYLGRSNSHD